MRIVARLIGYSTAGVVGLELASGIYSVVAQEPYTPSKNLVAKGPSRKPYNRHQTAISSAVGNIYLGKAVSKSDIDKFYEDGAVFEDPVTIFEGRSDIVDGLHTMQLLNITNEVAPSAVYYPNFIHVSLRNRYNAFGIQLPIRHEVYLELDARTGKITRHVDSWYNSKFFYAENGVAPWFAPICKGFSRAYLLAVDWAPNAFNH